MVFSTWKIYCFFSYLHFLNVLCTHCVTRVFSFLSYTKWHQKFNYKFSVSSANTPDWRCVLSYSKNIKYFSRYFTSVSVFTLSLHNTLSLWHLLHCKSSHENAIYWHGNRPKQPLIIFYGKSDKIQSGFEIRITLGTN